MNIGFICSSNGSVIRAIHELIGQDNKLFILTDRKCGVEEFACSNNIENIRIEYIDKKIFSQKAYEWFRERKVDIVVLFYLKLVGAELFCKIPTFNIHPSLLPAFKGFNAIEKMMKSNSKFIGCTLHLVNESIDGGHILAQNIFPVLKDDTAWLHKISYLQKIHLTLLLIELIKMKKIKINLGKSNISFNLISNGTMFSNPDLEEQKIIKLFIEFSRKNGGEVIAEFYSSFTTNVFAVGRNI